MVVSVVVFPGPACITETDLRAGRTPAVTNLWSKGHSVQKGQVEVSGLSCPLPAKTVLQRHTSFILNRKVQWNGFT